METQEQNNADADRSGVSIVYFEQVNACWVWDE